MLMPIIGDGEGVLDLHGSPAHNLTGSLQVNGHAGFHGNISRGRHEWIVDFLRRSENKWKLSRLKTDGMAEKKIRIVGYSSRAHTSDHSVEEILRQRAGSQLIDRLEHTGLNGVVALAMLVAWFRSDTAGFANVGVIAVDGTAHVDAENIPFLQNVLFDHGGVSAAADVHMHPENLPAGPGYLTFINSGKLALFDSRFRRSQHSVYRPFV